MNFNLNHETGIFLSNFEYGKTQNVEVKIGRKTYLCDFDKSSAGARVDFYKKLNKNRPSFSKYDPEAEKHSASIKSDAVLRREFFLEIEEIEKAQRILYRYKDVLDF